jgi:hypothetical protein
MPVKSSPRERVFIEMLLSEYEHGAWKSAVPDWLEERMDSAVEVLATRADGTTVAIEHTIVQPFVGEKTDSNTFGKAFGLIEKNPDLAVPERDMIVAIPVGAIPVGYKWEEVGNDLLAWLKANHRLAPKDGESTHLVPVGSSSKLGPLSLRIKLQTSHLPGHPGLTVISRGPMPKNLGDIVEEALNRKLPKLVNTVADRRILLFERQHVSLGDMQIMKEIEKLWSYFPQLDDVHEIWIVDTSILDSEGWIYFRHMDRNRGLIESLSFEKGVLKMRRDHGN